MEKSYLIRPAQFAEVRHFLALADDFDTSGGLEPIEETCATAECFAVLADGEMVGAYALDIVRHANGFEGVIVAAGGDLPGGNLAMSVLPDAERRFKGCAAVAVYTKRPGLAKLLGAQGYEFGGIVLRKKL